MPAWWEQLLHITTGRISHHEELPDLRHLPTRPVALERTHYLVNDRERDSQAPRTYVLRTQRGTRRSPAGVTVTSNGRSVGHLPAAAADAMGPLLDQLGGAAIVNGTGPKTGSIRLRVDLPTTAGVSEVIQTFADPLGLSDHRRRTA
jgi:GAF domain-containing protein